MTPQERWYYITHEKEIIERNLALFEEEKKTRQLKKFLQGKEDAVSGLQLGPKRKWYHFGRRT
jgi:hypothetical protein